MKPSLTVLKDKFEICQTASVEGFPGWMDKDCFFSITKTEEEISVICRQKDIERQGILNSVFNRRIIKVIGPFDMSVTGIIAGISAVLAQNNIPIFTISTYNTDYFLVSEEYLDASISILRNTGYKVTFE
jgi:hypothetical protein